LSRGAAPAVSAGVPDHPQAALLSYNPALPGVRGAAKIDAAIRLLSLNLLFVMIIGGKGTATGRFAALEQAGVTTVGLSGAYGVATGAANCVTAACGVSHQAAK